MHLYNNKRGRIMTESHSNPINKGRLFFGLLERVGAKGRYQNLLLLVLCLINYLSGALTFMPSFLFYADPYTCPRTYRNRTC